MYSMIDDLAKLSVADVDTRADTHTAPLKEKVPKKAKSMQNKKLLEYVVHIYEAQSTHKDGKQVQVLLSLEILEQLSLFKRKKNENDASVSYRFISYCNLLFDSLKSAKKAVLKKNLQFQIFPFLPILKLYAIVV